jgi:Pyruvate kinase, barrel domain
MRRNRNAKIVSTLGPASSSPELIRASFDAGADVFRLNFSHGTHDDHKRRFDAIRAIERDFGLQSQAPYLVRRLRRAFHSQQKLLNVISNSFPVNCLLNKRLAARSLLKGRFGLLGKLIVRVSRPRHGSLCFPIRRLFRSQTHLLRTRAPIVRIFDELTKPLHCRLRCFEQQIV